jgi:hypothetical protein
MNPIQIAVLALGALFAIAGIALFAKRGISGKNSIKIGGMEFQLSGSSLVVFVLGCGLVVVAARLETKAGPESSPKETARSPSPAPPKESVAPREFATQFLYRPDMIERVEYEVEPGQLPAEKMDEFLRLTRVAFGRDADRRQIFQVTVMLKNTGNRPILLDLTSRFFSLTDDHGGVGELLYFCCDSQGDMLSPGQEREIQLFFQSKGWQGKGLSAHQILFRIEGLLPVLRATWKFPTLATAA